MTLRLAGSTSGYTEIDAPAVAGSNTLILPGGNGTTDQALVTNGSGTLSWADRGRMVLGTSQNSTSGTSIDFTSIPSWARKITVMFGGVSTSGTSIVLIQIGSGSFTTSGYASGAAMIDSSSASSGLSTAGFQVEQPQIASITRQGAISLITRGSNAWVASGILNIGSYINGRVCYSAGDVTLSGTLDRVRITTLNGTDTFDAGSINILYEG